MSNTFKTLSWIKTEYIKYDIASGNLRLLWTELFDYLKTLGTADISPVLNLISIKSVWLFCHSTHNTSLALKPQSIKVRKDFRDYVKFDLTLDVEKTDSDGIT